MLNWSNKIKVMDLKKPITNYADQKTIDTSRVKKMLASTLQYDMYILTMIRFLEKKHPGEYRNSKSTINALEKSKCN